MVYCDWILHETGRDKPWTLGPWTSHLETQLMAMDSVVICCNLRTLTGDWAVYVVCYKEIPYQKSLYRGSLTKVQVFFPHISPRRTCIFKIHGSKVWVMKCKIRFHNLWQEPRTPFPHLSLLEKVPVWVTDWIENPQVFNFKTRSKLKWKVSRSS